MLIGICDNSASLIQVRFDGKAKVVRNYAIIGHGRVTGGLLLLNEFYRNDLDDWEASHLASLVINRVSQIDSTVGDIIDYRICWGKNDERYSVGAEEGINDESERYWLLLVKLYWELQKYEDLEDSINELFEEIEPDE